jgi:hypothetical protein
MLISLDSLPQNLKEKEKRQKWMILTKYWCRTECLHNNSKDNKIFNYVFAHCNDDKEIFLVTDKEIARAQVTDKLIQKTKANYENKLVKNIYVLCKEEDV